MIARTPSANDERSLFIWPILILGSTHRGVICRLRDAPLGKGRRGGPVPTNAGGIQHREKNWATVPNVRGLAGQDSAERDSAERGLTGRLTEVALGYQRVLTGNPGNPEALVGMSLVALASRQTEAAVKMAEAAVAAVPPATRLEGAAWVALGQALNASARSEEAERAYWHAIRLDGMDALARLGLGELRIASGRAEEAAREFELALRRQPWLVAAHLGLGNALALAGRNEEALARYEHALALQPRFPEAEYAAGFALARLGRAKEAETRYRRALTLRPDFAAVWVSLGCLLREDGRDVWAEAALKRAIELRPDLIAGWINLALLERERGRPAEAETHLRRAFARNPEQVETLVAWCQFRAAEQDLAGAWGLVALGSGARPGQRGSGEHGWNSAA